MMINYCGDFNEHFLKKCEKSRKYFDKKLKLVNSDTSNKIKLRWKNF